MSVGCAKDRVSGKSTFNFYAIQQEVPLGRNVLKSQLNAFREKKVLLDAYADRVEYQRIQRIVSKLQQVTHYPQFSYEIHLAKLDDVVNAWCAPGGKMMVYTGLWNKKNGLVDKGHTDQLAAVIAHEMAHANARHVTESLSRNMTIMVVGSVVQSAIYGSGSSENSNLFGKVFKGGIGLFIPSYSRKNELEADQIGLFYMAKSGYDPRAAIKLWKKAAKQKRRAASVYASHPSSGERFKALEKILPRAMELYRTSQMKK